MSDSSTHDEANQRTTDATDESATEPTRVEELEAANRDLRERVDELESIVAEIAPSARRTERPVDDGSTTEAEAVADEPPTAVPSGGQSHKVVGKFSDSNGGVGVYGHNTASSGTTYGVWGEVDSGDGYGLYTPNDLRAEGALEGQRLATDGDINMDRAENDQFRDLHWSTNGKMFYNPSGSGVVTGESLWGSSGVDVLYLGSHANIVFTEFGTSGTRQRTAGPVAKAYVNADASIANEVNVASCSWNSSGRYYDITLQEDDYWFDEYATVVTSDFGDEVTWSVGSGGSDLLIEPSDDQQHAFQFVTFKLIAGQATSVSSTSSGPDSEVDESQVESRPQEGPDAGDQTVE